MLHKFTCSDFQEIYDVINDAAAAYQNVVPDDCWHEPYMPGHELKRQIQEGVEFWCYKEDGKILG